jgi:hypothetical protein
MAVKRYNGTSWDTVAGLGAQGAAATSSSITTWVKTATGGETSLTGSSDSSTTLAYTPGQEQLFINGVLQVRGSDYTATNGTSITGLTALVAGDIATVTTVNAFSVTGAVPLSTVTANGDLIVGTSSGAVGRLGIGSTDQVLKVSGGVPVWATPAGGGKVLQVVSAVYNTKTDSTTASYIDTGLTATITPTLATSTIIVAWGIDWRKDSANAANAVNMKLLRGATAIVTSYSLGYTGSAIYNIGTWAGSYKDSPATTSATTYKVQFNSDNGTGTVSSIPYGANSLGSIVLMEIGA